MSICIEAVNCNAEPALSVFGKWLMNTLKETSNSIHHVHLKYFAQSFTF